MSTYDRPLRQLFRILSLTAVVVFSPQVLAQHPELDPYWCAEDISNVGNCTANEVSLANVTNVELAGGITECVEGSTVTLNTITAELNSNTGERFDVTIWIGKEANDPRQPGTATSCRVSSLPDFDGPGGDILDLEGGQDDCLDLQQPAVPIQFVTSEPTDLICADSDGDGSADVQVLITWWQNQNFVCNNPDPAKADKDPPYDPALPVFSPGAPSKCDYTVIDLGIDFVRNPSLSLVKSTTTTEITTVDQVVPYTYVVKNTGDEDLTNVTLGDNNTDATPSCNPAQPASLAADLVAGDGEEMSCTASHTVTQDEIDFETEVCNTATADSDQTGPVVQNICIPIIKDAGIVLTKTGTLNDTDSSGGTNAGDQITYVFTVENTGNITLHNVDITDADAIISGGPIDLAPVATDSSTFTGVYTLTGSDIPGESFTNVAFVNTDEGVSDSDDDTQTWTYTPPPPPPAPIEVSTLDRYGLVLLGLLMLGVGLAGYRRFG